MIAIRVVFSLTTTSTTMRGAYMEFQFMDDRTQAQIAPSGAFDRRGCAPPRHSGRHLGVNCSNPIQAAESVSGIQLPGGARRGDTDLSHVTFGRRNVEGGDAGRPDPHLVPQVLGVRGDINDAWNYDMYFRMGSPGFPRITATTCRN